MYKISFFVPEIASEFVKIAMFDAGAGKIGNYDHCSFETLGTGQFRALLGANPVIGRVGELEKVRELKIEMVCEDTVLKEVVMALKKHHPYEMPAYHITKLTDF